MPFLPHRPRRLRQSEAIRSMVRETALRPAQFIAPLFVVEGLRVREEIASMPGYYRLSLDNVHAEVRELWDLGIRSVLLFAKVPDALKDNAGREAQNPQGLLPRAVQAAKASAPGMAVLADVALDPFSIHGHDGIVEGAQIVNDPTVEVLAQMSVVLAQAGADFVAPSDMMDGRVRAIRAALDQAGFTNAGIMAYTAKYASCFYGPFRDALDSAPGFGDKQTYQMDPANSREALRELGLDVAEGADIVMVKPGLPYLDVLARMADASPVPVAVYQVSGEYAMLKAAAASGWLQEPKAILETMLAFRRAGAHLIATYFAKDAARLLQSE